MIPKIILGQGGTRGLIRYLFGKGRANEHVDPHLVASWNDFAPDPGRSPHRDPKEVEKQLAAQLDQPVQMLGDLAPQTTFWHCPVRAAPEDPILTDAQWAEVARRIVAAAGLAPGGDEQACRWVAVRHADDHIHIAATLVRQDGRRPQRNHDKRAVQKEARQIEIDYGLRRLKAGDGTAAKRPTSKEHFKAKRLGRDTTAREVLRVRVRRAVAAAHSEAEFFALLEATGVNVRLKRGPSGDALGCNFALPGDTNENGEPLWFAGSTLSPDLSLPRIRERLTTTVPEPVTARPGDPWHQATAATERIPRHLSAADAHVAQGQLVALGAALDLLPVIAPASARADLQQAAIAFERATRSRISADLDSTRVLRRSVQAIWRDHPQDKDGAGFAMLLDAIFTAVAFAAHWHRTRQNAQQEEAAERALLHLRAAYGQVAEPALASLARRAPAQQTKHRLAHHIQQAVPDYAERILDDPAWEALATVLAEAEAAGHNAATILSQALGQRTLEDAHNPARALTWRIRRLSQRHTPSPRAQAARAIGAAQHPGFPARPTPVTPLPQRSPAQRR
ncbi:relaxase/mobilization nuclease domain-containing protein [Streptomyces sp. NPDC021093]|uniref:relaxase/mobilization nuclease domain-containing protein n=1 Tax=Streptomyces sp. NPDC021093 TaxID=3365112 RepID=UPI0037A3E843